MRDNPSWSRRGTYVPRSRDSSLLSCGGLRCVVDASLPATSRAVVTDSGYRVGIVSRVGSKYVGSWDGGSQFSSLAEAAQACENASL